MVENNSIFNLFIAFIFTGVEKYLVLEEVSSFKKSENIKEKIQFSKKFDEIAFEYLPELIKI